MAAVVCVGCASDIHPLEVFPGSLCPGCYEKKMEGTPLPTAAEIVAMWGGPVVAKVR